MMKKDATIRKSLERGARRDESGHFREFGLSLVLAICLCDVTKFWEKENQKQPKTFFVQQSIPPGLIILYTHNARALGRGDLEAGWTDRRRRTLT
jgi:hypothetical protein